MQKKSVKECRKNAVEQCSQAVLQQVTVQEDKEVNYGFACDLLTIIFFVKITPSSLNC